MSYKRINITLPEDLVKELSDAVTEDYTTRSAYIREAIVLKLQVDRAIINEISDNNSMTNLVKGMHMQRMNRRHIRSIGSLSYSEAQD